MTMPETNCAVHSTGNWLVIIIINDHRMVTLFYF